MNKVIIIVLILIVVGIGVLLLATLQTGTSGNVSETEGVGEITNLNASETFDTNASNINTSTGNNNTNTQTTNTSQTQTFTFGTPKKSAHYVSNQPAHGSTLTSSPQTVSINFNFVLASNSSISIKNEGKEYGSGAVKISSDKYTLSRGVDPTTPNGLYTVNYTACWPDQSCHDGSFQFAIDRP